MNRGAILSLLVAGLLTGGYVELVTNQSDARSSDAEEAQGAIDMVQSAEAVEATRRVRATGMGIYLIDALLVRPANADPGQVLEVNVRLRTFSVEVVAQHEVAIRDALIDVLEARTLKGNYARSTINGLARHPLQRSELDAIEKIVGPNIVFGGSIDRTVPPPPSRQSR